MWPVILEIGPIKLYSFGLMAALALLGGSFLLKLEMDRNRLGEGRWNNYAIVALLGGFAGAKINYLITEPDLLRESLFGSLISGAGLVWYGGFIGGAFAAFLLSRYYRHPYGVVADCFAPALAIAYMLGRVGCLISGDGDYGVPSDLPWAMAFPNGIVPTSVPVHPTPIYEILIRWPRFSGCSGGPVPAVGVHTATLDSICFWPAWSGSSWSSGGETFPEPSG